MKYFVAQLTEGKHINVPADRMELQEDTILAYAGDNLVAIVDKSAALSAHISEKAPSAPTSPTQEQETPQAPTPPQTPNTQPEQSTKPTETGYKGFLYIKCEHCGTIKGFCTKNPITAHRCECGHLTELRTLKPMTANCKCGETFRYRTNLTDRMVSINCINCESPIDLELHAKKGVYETIE